MRISKFPLGPGILGNERKANFFTLNVSGGDELENLLAQMGKQDFEAQYQQRPNPSYNAFFKREWIRRHGLSVKRQPRDRVVQSWDMASKASEFNSFSVCTTWLIRSEEAFLLDVYRDRMDIVKLLGAVKSLSAEWKPDVILIEDASAGTQVIQLLKKPENRIQAKLKGIQPKQNKVERWFVQVQKFAEGLVSIPEEADWLEAYLDELFRFPDSAFSDQVDSTSQFLKWLETANWPPQFPGNQPPAMRIRNRPGTGGPKEVRDSKGKWIARRIKLPKS